MPTRKKSIARLIAAASAAWLAACAADRERAPEAPYPPLVIDSHHTPTPAELYAQRFPTSSVQVRAGETVRFIRCAVECPGATPKTPVAGIQAAAVRAVKPQQRVTPTVADAPGAQASGARPPGTIATNRAEPEPQRQGLPARSNEFPADAGIHRPKTKEQQP